MSNPLTATLEETALNAPNINVTPLIDVLLVLLIIFMVVTPVKPSKFDAKIPSEPKSNGGEPHPHTIVVSLNDSHQLLINREVTTSTIDDPQAAIDRLKEVFANREHNFVNERTVFVKAPKRIDYGSVAKIVDAIKQSGASPISLQIDELE